MFIIEYEDLKSHDACFTARDQFVRRFGLELRLHGSVHKDAALIAKAAPFAYRHSHNLWQYIPDGEERVKFQNRAWRIQGLRDRKEAGRRLAKAFVLAIKPYA